MALCAFKFVAREVFHQVHKKLPKSTDKKVE